MLTLWGNIDERYMSCDWQTMHGHDERFTATWLCGNTHERHFNETTWWTITTVIWGGMLLQNTEELQRGNTWRAVSDLNYDESQVHIVTIIHLWFQCWIGIFFGKLSFEFPVLGLEFQWVMSWRNNVQWILAANRIDEVVSWVSKFRCVCLFRSDAVWYVSYVHGRHKGFVLVDVWSLREILPLQVYVYKGLLCFSDNFGGKKSVMLVIMSFWDDTYRPVYILHIVHLLHMQCRRFVPRWQGSFFFSGNKENICRYVIVYVCCIFLIYIFLQLMLLTSSAACIFCSLQYGSCSALVSHFREFSVVFFFCKSKCNIDFTVPFLFCFCDWLCVIFNGWYLANWLYLRQC